MDSSTRSAKRSPSRGAIATRLLGLGAVAVLAVAASASPASATVPGNDEVGGAVAVGIGDHITLDTTAATTTQADADLNSGSGCGAPATKASVWYTYTAGADGGVVLDMSASDYSGGFLVFEGTPTADSLIQCGPSTVGFGVASGVTYTIMVIDDDEDGNTASGGNLVLDVNEAPPPPTVALTVDPKAKVDKSGTAWVTGSYTCTDSDFVEIDGDLQQAVGRFTVNGYGFFYDEGTCDGSAHRFSMPVSGENGKFAGGKAASFSYSYVCGPFECADGWADQQLQLTKGR